VPAQRGPLDGSAAGPATDVEGVTRSGRVLLIDPDTTASQSLAHALTAIGIATVTTAPGFDPDTDAASLAGAADVDPATELAVVSLRLGPSAADTIRALRAAGWNRVIALSAAAGIEEITDALAAGATGAVITGHAAPAHNVPTGIYDLSPREVEVLRMVADGRANKWIGERLDLSALTVKSHLARIGRKLGTGDRAHMVALALRAGVMN
jgi:DNA-binding NarL/FixJ family response regulator